MTLRLVGAHEKPRADRRVIRRRLIIAGVCAALFAPGLWSATRPHEEPPVTPQSQPAPQASKVVAPILTGEQQVTEACRIRLEAVGMDVSLCMPNELYPEVVGRVVLCAMAADHDRCLNKMFAQYTHWPSGPRTAKEWG